MKEYFYPSLLFKKKWIWFADPYDPDGVDMVNFFSYNKVEAKGFRKKNRMTTIIDLSQDIEVIWEKMRKNYIRKQIKRGEKRGIIVRQDSNFKDFKRVYHNFRKGKKITKDNYNVFKQNGLLFSAYYKDEMIAGGIFIASRPYIRAWVLASVRFENKEKKIDEIIGQANRMVIWEAIKYSYNNGYKLFDLGGIKISSSDKSKLAVVEFKEAFGGKRKECFFYYKVYSKLLKILINI